MEKKSISKDALIKIIAIAIAAVICITGVTLWLTYYRPFDDSYKRVTIQIVDEENGYSKTFYIRTNAASLAELIKEKDEWGIIYEEGSWGMYIKGVNNSEVDSGHWVSILTSDANYYDASSTYNDEYTAKNGVACISSSVGADYLALADGETYVIIVLVANW